MGDVTSSMSWTWSANWASLPFLRSKICDSTWVCTKGQALSFFSTLDVHSCSRIDTVRKVMGLRSSDLKSRIECFDHWYLFHTTLEISFSWGRYQGALPFIYSGGSPEVYIYIIYILRRGGHTEELTQLFCMSTPCRPIPLIFIKIFFSLNHKHYLFTLKLIIKVFFFIWFLQFLAMNKYHLHWV